MGDIAFVWDAAALTADWSLEAAGLQEDGGLGTAVILSLFTDRRAEPTDAIPDGSDDRRGVWSDLFLEAGDRQGSRLWLLQREKLTESVRARAEDYAREALAWLIEDGVADRVAIAARIVPTERLELDVTVSRDGRTLFDGRYGLIWQALAGGAPARGEG